MPKGKRGKPPEDGPVISVIDDAPPPPPLPPSDQDNASGESAVAFSAISPDRFRGVHLAILNDMTPELSVEGARDSGKSVVCVWKEVQQLKDHPGMKSFLFRYSDADTQSKLVPFFREICALQGEYPKWDNKELCFTFANGSIAFMFGLRATTASQRYSKMRGLGVARVYCDQTEEVPADIGLEMRAALRQPGYAHQLTYCANPPYEKFWLATQFPLDNRFKGRKLYQIALYDNSHNLSAETIRKLEVAFPPEHPKYLTLILGRRGPNVTGEPIYGKLFNTALHVRPVAYDAKAILYEGIDFGKLNPCWMVAQRPYGGGLRWLGGVIGMEMFLDDFIPIVQALRASWFPLLQPDRIKTCCTLSVSFADSDKFAGLKQLRKAGFQPTWKPGSNSPDVVLATIEQQASYLRRRGSDGQEMLLVNDAEDRWLKCSSEGMEPAQFMAQAYGGGYSWAEKDVSVGRNELKQPADDDWFIYAMRVAEAIELNFGGQQTQEEIDKAAADAKKIARPYRAGARWQ